MKSYSLYVPRDFPTYEQEEDARFERDQLTPCIHQGKPAAPRWVPQVEYHPGPTYRSLGYYKAPERSF